MINRIYNILLAGLTTVAVSTTAMAQSTPVSPEYKGNNVTFRLLGPNAKTVKADGTTMKKNNQGVWEASKTKNGYFEYTMNVDGDDVTDPGNEKVKREGNSTKSQGYGVTGQYPNVPHGTVSQVWCPADNFGPNNCKYRRMLVYTPPGYETSGEKYPVLYLLHGWMDDEGAWFIQGNIANFLDVQIAQKKVKPMIVVSANLMASDDAEPGHGQFVMKNFDDKNNRRNGHGTFENGLTKDIKPFMEKYYRCKTDKYSRAICGLSHGGGITMQMYINQPDWFGYIGLFSAANLQKFYNGNTSDAKLKAGYQKNPPRLFYIACGKSDNGQLPHAQALNKKFNDLGLKHEYHESNGGHNWGNWRDYINYVLPRLFDTETTDDDKPDDQGPKYYIYNVGQKKFIKTGGSAKTPDTPELTDNKAEATAQVVTKADDGTYTIADPDWPLGWGMQGRNTIYISMDGGAKTNSWGTNYTPGFNLVKTGDADGSVYLEYKWPSWASGSITLADDPSNKTYAVTYGNYDVSTDGWKDNQKADVAAPLVYGGQASNLAKYGSNAKWILTTTLDIPAPTGISSVSISPEAASAVYSINGSKVADKASKLQNLPKGIYIKNGRKFVVK